MVARGGGGLAVLSAARGGGGRGSGRGGLGSRSVAARPGGGGVSRLRHADRVRSCGDVHGSSLSFRRRSGVRIIRRARFLPASACHSDSSPPYSTVRTTHAFSPRLAPGFVSLHDHHLRHLLLALSGFVFGAPRYIGALYWAIVTITSTGYGDILPTTSAEMQVRAPGLHLHARPAWGATGSTQQMDGRRHAEKRCVVYVMRSDDIPPRACTGLRLRAAVRLVPLGLHHRLGMRHPRDARRRGRLPRRMAVIVVLIAPIHRMRSSCGVARSPWTHTRSSRG